jgi:hypothetical protein
MERFPAFPLLPLGVPRSFPTPPHSFESGALCFDWQMEHLRLGGCAGAVNSMSRLSFRNIRVAVVAVNFKHK